ncbi:RsmB/NOP family class I SAM-dependent RNA methyltransferase [Georgenia sp. Z1344]|uniref:RsmB/NOP family class I SAM-dependent RNA methyltransferase n=1 Tax=Georgenia sp. Z1344 TaxID=3416706 RepID=UPI003CF70F7E
MSDDRGPRRGGTGRGSGKQTRAPRTDPARRAAYQVLHQVHAEDAYANLVLPGLLRERGITGRDAAFATELAYGTLRLRGRYDAILALASGRDVDSLDPPVRDVLRLGAHQLLGMRVPSHAAVAESVSLAREVAGPAPTGLVNAVLRKVAGRDVEDWLDDVADAVRDSGGEWFDVAAAVESHPAWVVRALRQALVADGRDPRELGDLLDADNTPARVTLVARPGWSSVGELGRQARDLGADVEQHPLPGAVDLVGIAPGELADVATGRAAVQDAGSQLVAHALLAADLTDGRTDDGGTWLDLCAGPGGKAALLAARAQERGALLVANEVQPHRADLVRRAVERAGESVRVTVGDGRRAGELMPADGPDGGPDGATRILLDAPCTGLGALRRRPEARWRRSTDDLAQLAELQHELFEAAAGALAVGGVLAYVTCSPHVTETRAQVTRLLRGSPGLALLDTGAITRSVAGGLADLVTGSPVEGAEGTVVQLWPHVHGTDAMFLALLRREG